MTARPCQLSRPKSLESRLLRTLAHDQAGQVTVEWALILAAVALPMFYVFRTCLHLLAYHYRMVTMLNSMPFP